MGLYHRLDVDTNLKYKLLGFLTPNKKNSKRKALAFNRDRCCHLALCLWLILFHCVKMLAYYDREMTTGANIFIVQALGCPSCFLGSKSESHNSKNYCSVFNFLEKVFFLILSVIFHFHSYKPFSGNTD